MTKDDTRARKTQAYLEGRQNKWDFKNGPNPYAEECQEWLDWEFGWGEAENLKEEKSRVDAEIYLADARQEQRDMEGVY